VVDHNDRLHRPIERGHRKPAELDQERWRGPALREGRCREGPAVSGYDNDNPGGHRYPALG